MAAPRRCVRSRPVLALLIALGLLLLANQVATRWAPPQNPEPMPFRARRPLFLLGPSEPGFIRSGMGEPITDYRPGAPYRILLLGSSALRGGGVVRFQSIPGYLQRLLDAEGVSAEVINGGVPGSDSGHQVEFLIQGLDKLRPDLVVHYGGNNEFFKLLIYKQQNPQWSVASERLRANLDRLPLYRWLALQFQQPSPSQGTVGMAIFKLSSTIAREEVPLVEARYQRNLTLMGEACRKRGVPLVLCGVAVNEMFPPKDHFPSAPPDLDAQVHAAMKEGRLVDFLEEQVRRFPDRAWAHFAYGQLLLEKGRTKEAAAHLSAAVELDPAPVRTLPSQVDAARRASQAGGALFLDVPARLRREYGPILGDQVFLDHCHFLPQANRAVARELVDLRKGRGLLPAPASKPLVQAQDPLDLEAFQLHDDMNPNPSRAPREWDCLPPDVAERLGWNRRATRHPAGNITELGTLPSEKTVEGQALRGHLAFLALKPEQAASRYRQALALAPGRAVLWRNLGHALMMAGQIPESLESWGRFLRLGGKDPRLERLLRVRQEASQTCPLRQGRGPGGTQAPDSRT
jgi:tetratricopeptide (TPR) repeat protein